MIRVGENVPDFEVRTDEGTPLSIADLKGRSLILFLLGESFTPAVERLLSVLAKHTSKFLSLESSPVAILGETVEQLSAYRERNNVPFLMLSDPSLTIHWKFREEDGDDVGVWVADQSGLVVETIPMLPPTELVSVAVKRSERLYEEKRAPKSD